MKNKIEKTVVSVNLGNFGSTGKIMYQISEYAKQSHYKTYCAYPAGRQLLPSKESDIIIGTIASKFISVKLAKWTGYNGCFSFVATFNFLRKLDSIKPSILHLHNIHNSYINLNMLFKYVKRNNIAVVWTLHDCWAFTGHCSHFLFNKCDKWKNGCGECKDLKIYPTINVDTTRKLWYLKKKWFTGVPNLTVVTPSRWLAGCVKESFLSTYSLETIYNGIDLNVFKPIQSNFREHHGISSKGDIMLLGVAYDWNYFKGLDVFIELAKRLPANYKIVLVGTTEELDLKLPSNIICVHKTNNSIELAQIYTAADIFVNPSRQDVLGMVNIESLACGTPVIAFDVGGVPETIDDRTGMCVPCGDLERLENGIYNMVKSNKYSAEDCLERAKRFSKEYQLARYISLYDKLIGINTEFKRQNNEH